MSLNRKRQVAGGVLLLRKLPSSKCWCCSQAHYARNQDDSNRTATRCVSDLPSLAEKSVSLVSTWSCYIRARDAGWLPRGILYIQAIYTCGFQATSTYQAYFRESLVQEPCMILTFCFASACAVAESALAPLHFT